MCWGIFIKINKYIHNFSVTKFIMEYYTPLIYIVVTKYLYPIIFVIYFSTYCDKILAIVLMYASSKKEF